MYDILLELFHEFGIDRMPETFPELIPWLVAVFLSIAFVIYIFDMIFIVVKALSGRGKSI